MKRLGIKFGYGRNLTIWMKEIFGEIFDRGFLKKFGKKFGEFLIEFSAINAVD